MCAVRPIQLSMFLIQAQSLDKVVTIYLLIFDVEVDVKSVQELGVEVR